MQKPGSIYVCIAIIVLSSFLVSCGGGSSSVSENPNTRRFGPFEFELTTTNTTFTRGESVPVTFAVRNVSSKTVNVVVPGCIILHKITLGSQDITPGINCAGDIQSYSFAPNETKTYTDDYEHEVQAGQNTIKVWYHADNIDGTIMTDAQTEQNLYANPIQVTVAP
jgi:hypothetical protein